MNSTPQDNPSGSPLTTLLKKRKTRRVIALFLVALLVGIFSATLDRGPSPAEKTFHHWINDLRTARPATSDARSIVTIRMYAPSISSPFDWTIGGTPETTPQALRLLEILKESKISLLQELAPGEDLPTQKKDIIVVAQDGLRRFVAQFSSREAESTIQIQNFLKLAQLLYATRPAPSPSPVLPIP